MTSGQEEAIRNCTKVAVSGLALLGGAVANIFKKGAFKKTYEHTKETLWSNKGSGCSCSSSEPDPVGNQCYKVVLQEVDPADRTNLHKCFTQEFGLTGAESMAILFLKKTDVVKYRLEWWEAKEYCKRINSFKAKAKVRCM